MFFSFCNHPTSTASNTIIVRATLELDTPIATRMKPRVATVSRSPEDDDEEPLDSGDLLQGHDMSQEKLTDTDFFNGARPRFSFLGANKIVKILADFGIFLTI